MGKRPIKLRVSSSTPSEPSLMLLRKSLSPSLRTPDITQLNTLPSLDNPRSRTTPFVGVDAMHKGTTNMAEQGIYESVMSKTNQLELATQVVKMILKIDDVIAPQQYE